VRPRRAANRCHPVLLPFPRSRNGTPFTSLSLIHTRIYPLSPSLSLSLFRLVHMRAQKQPMKKRQAGARTLEEAREKRKRAKKKGKKEALGPPTYPLCSWRRSNPCPDST